MADGRLIAGRPYRPSWVQGLRVQSRVIGALMVRDALSRYGHDNLGFFWIVAEPLILTSGIMIIWSVLKLTHGSEVGVVPFALTGYSFITLWRHIVGRSVHALRQDAKLNYHRQVNFLDVLIARASLETVGIFSAFMVALVPLWLFGLCPGIQNPLALVGGFLLSALFSFGFGMTLAGLSEMSEILEHFIQPVMYVTIPLTGIFYMVEWLPPGVQMFVQWSPLVNGMEMFRAGLLGNAFPTHWDGAYLFTCAIITTCLGLVTCKYAATRVQN